MLTARSTTVILAVVVAVVVAVAVAVAVVVAAVDVAMVSKNRPQMYASCCKGSIRH